MTEIDKITSQYKLIEGLLLMLMIELASESKNLGSSYIYIYIEFIFSKYFRLKHQKFF